MALNRGWRLDERFHGLKISLFEPLSVDTISGISSRGTEPNFEHDAGIENAIAEALPWDASGSLTRIKKEPTEISNTPPSVTLSALSQTVDGDQLKPVKSGYNRFSRSDINNDIFDQLHRYAVSMSQRALDNQSQSNESSELEIEEAPHDSKEEDPFPTSVSITPCPSKTKATKHPQHRAITKLRCKAPKAIESVLCHKWTPDEREILCVLHRWYLCDETTQTAEAVSTLFNALTGLNLRHQVIKRQFRDHLCLYGTKAFPEFARACEITPFNDIDNPNGQYTSIHRRIQDESRSLGVRLERRQEDVRFANGKAARAKSEYTRRIYKRLVRTASQSSLSSLEAPLEPHPQDFLPKRALLVIPKNDNDSFGDIEDKNVPSSATMRTSVKQNQPHLAFRIFNGNNKTMLKSFGFQAARFTHLDNLLREDAPLDYPELWNSHAIKHLEHDGGSSESAFVSVFVNLLQTLCNAPQKDAVIAVIDLRHPSLSEEANKLHHAYDVLKELKDKGLVPRARSRNGPSRYRGVCEYVRWGDWPAASFLHVFPWRDLEQLVAENTYVADLLDLELFQEYSTGAVAKRLREKRFVLNNRSATAMGKLGRVFGLSGKNASARHIAEFVRHVIEGWNVKPTSVDDLQTLSDISYHFALALGSNLHIQSVMAAFMDGVREGVEGRERFEWRRRS